MKAIRTTYHGPGNVRGSRISATDEDGNRVTMPYDHSVSSEDNHDAAAVALCQKMGWRGVLVSGSIKGGQVYVWLDDSALVQVTR